MTTRERPMLCDCPTNVALYCNEQPNCRVLTRKAAPAAEPVARTHPAMRAALPDKQSALAAVRAAVLLPRGSRSFAGYQYKRGSPPPDAYENHDTGDLLRQARRYLDQWQVIPQPSARVAGFSSPQLVMLLALQVQRLQDRVDELERSNA